MKKSLIVILLVVVGLITACQPGTTKAIAPVITEAPKPSKTLEGQYQAFSRVWSQGSDNETVEDYNDTIEKLKGVRYTTRDLPESAKKEYLLAYMDEMILALEGAMRGKDADYINERFRIAEVNLNAYKKEK